MGTTLHTLAPNPGATRKKKRIGRGPGSRTGKTAGKGTKGQRARTGHHGARIGFEGGQMPMQRRLPKRGFHNPFREQAYPINVGVLDRFFEGGGDVDLDALRGAGLVPKGARIVKILAGGEVKAKLNVKAHRFSKSAVAKLEAAGGTAEVVPLPGAATDQSEGGAAAGGSGA
jgi:large subunit ribosomal protein L15